MLWVTAFSVKLQNDPHYNSAQQIMFFEKFEFFKAVQNQPSRGLLRKRCSENMQHIYRRTSMPKCDSKKVALIFLIENECNARVFYVHFLSKILKQLYWNHTLARVFSCKFAVYLRNTLWCEEHLWTAASGSCSQVSRKVYSRVPNCRGYLSPCLDKFHNSFHLIMFDFYKGLT